MNAADRQTSVPTIPPAPMTIETLQPKSPTPESQDSLVGQASLNKVPYRRLENGETCEVGQADKYNPQTYRTGGR